jgi:hypothetical protein
MWYIEGGLASKKKWNMSRSFSYCLALVLGVSLLAGCTTRHYHSNDNVTIKTNPAGTSTTVKDKSHPGNSKIKIHVKDKD